MFPSLGYFDEKRGYWKLLVHGRVFSTETVPLGTRWLLKGLKRAMKATPEQVASDVFQQRIEGFLTKPIARRRIVLQLGEQKLQLRRRTRGSGVFYSLLRLPKDQFPPPQTKLNGENQLLERRVISIRLVRPATTTDSVQPAVVGDVHLVQPLGLSIISDIDDTIKMTEATCRSEMLANTFLRPFEVVEGMVELYQAWHAQGADFHYVSSSPWQLYQPLADLCMSSNFPAGSMHLRYFRIRDEMFKRWRPVRNNKKVGIIGAILKWLPKRQFVLVGDSGERDPEVYRFLAKRFPNQVVAILIRNLQSRPLDRRRIRKLESISKHCEVRLYRNASEIADVASRYL
jgi:phosphatidate phosphatase APP1